jgi:hypothetical protein
LEILSTTNQSSVNGKLVSTVDGLKMMGLGENSA